MFVSAPCCPTTASADADVSGSLDCTASSLSNSTISLLMVHAFGMQCEARTQFKFMPLLALTAHRRSLSMHAASRQASPVLRRQAPAAATAAAQLQLLGHRPLRSVMQVKALLPPRRRL